MQPKVAFVYDRVNTPFGGAEKVLLALHELYPEAPLFTSVYDPATAPWANVFTVIPSFLQRFPGSTQAHRWLAAAMPLAFEAFDLSEYDLIISITSAEAKGILTKPHQLHVCYLLTPTRYLYSHRQQYLENELHYLSRFLAKPLLSYLKWWDQSAAYRPDFIIPISKLVADRCLEFYKRETQPVIYPPVELSPMKVNKPSDSLLKQLPQNYFLIISRLVSYKRVDLAIAACEKLEVPLIVVGTGPEKNKLQQQVKNKELVTFLDNVSDNQLQALYNQAQGLLMIGEEDFGITALEAVGQGVPVIVYKKSGAAELLVAGEDGYFLTELTVNSVTAAVMYLKNHTFDKIKMRKKIQNYDTTEFQRVFQTTLTKLWQQFNSERTV